MNGTIRKATRRIVSASRTLGLGMPEVEVMQLYSFYRVSLSYAIASSSIARTVSQS